MITFENKGNTYGVTAKGQVVKNIKFGAEGSEIDSWVPIKDSNELESAIAEPYIDLSSHPKIPYEIFNEVRMFFTAVYSRFKSEAFVYLSYCPEEKKYTIVVPPNQTASAAHVTFEGYMPRYCKDCQIGSEFVDQTTCDACGSENMGDTHIYGTMHSHGNMGAFHSSVDDENELDMTGFHITLGKVENLLGCEVAHSYVVAQKGTGTTDAKGKGTRYKENLDITDLIEFPFLSGASNIRRWMSTVIAAAAIEYLADDHDVLLVDGHVKDLSGDLAKYERISKSLTSLGGTKIEDIQIATLSTIVSKASNVHTLLKDGLKPSKKSAAATGAVITVGGTAAGAAKAATTTQATTGSQEKTKGSGSTDQTQTTKTSTSNGLYPTRNTLGQVREEGLKDWIKKPLAARNAFTESLIKLVAKEISVSISGGGVLRLNRVLAGNDTILAFDQTRLQHCARTTGEKALLGRAVIYDLLTSASDVLWHIQINLSDHESLGKDLEANLEIFESEVKEFLGTIPQKHKYCLQGALYSHSKKSAAETLNEIFYERSGFNELDAGLNGKGGYEEAITSLGICLWGIQSWMVIMDNQGLWPNYDMHHLMTMFRTCVVDMTADLIKYAKEGQVAV